MDTQEDRVLSEDERYKLALAMMVKSASREELLAARHDAIVHWAFLGGRDINELAAWPPADVIEKLREYMKGIDLFLICKNGEITKDDLEAFCDAVTEGVAVAQIAELLAALACSAIESQSGVAPDVIELFVDDLLVHVMDKHESIAQCSRIQQGFGRLSSEHTYAFVDMLLSRLNDAVQALVVSLSLSSACDIVGAREEPDMLPFAIKLSRAFSALAMLCWLGVIPDSDAYVWTRLDDKDAGNDKLHLVMLVPGSESEPQIATVLDGMDVAGLLFSSLFMCMMVDSIHPVLTATDTEWGGVVSYLASQLHINAFEELRSIYGGTTPKETLESVIAHMNGTATCACNDTIISNLKDANSLEEFVTARKFDVIAYMKEQHALNA